MPDYEPKIIHLPGTRLSAEAVLHRSADKSDHATAAIVLIRWKDGSWGVDWSNMENRDFTFACALLNMKQGEVLSGEAIYEGRRSS